MVSLVVFDFDRTIVHEDTDAVVTKLLSEKCSPHVWDKRLDSWPAHMNEVFGQLHQAEFQPEDILNAIGNMQNVPGIPELIRAFAAHDWHVVIISDSNSVFVLHWLKMYNLDSKITRLITNRAYFDCDGRLHSKPYSEQNSCTTCPKNLCKSLALAEWRRNGDYQQVVYVGDGQNDFCPMKTLGSKDIVFPRRGLTCDKLIQKALESEVGFAPKFYAWTDGFQIIDTLFPHTNGRRIEI